MVPELALAPMPAWRLQIEHLHACEHIAVNLPPAAYSLPPSAARPNVTRAVSRLNPDAHAAAAGSSTSTVVT